MKLYHFPGACSMAPHIALNWVGAEFELEKPDHGSAEFLAINSMNQVPVLVLDDGTQLTQCNAILRFIAESHPAAGIGGGPSPREQYAVNRWLSFVATDLHRSHAPYFFPQRFIKDGTEQEQQRMKAATETLIAGLFEQCDRWLSDQAYTAGDQPTIADAYAFTVFRWSRKMTRPAYSFPNIKTYMDRMLANQAVQAAMRREGVE